jgi:hypothetical protein
VWALCLVFAPASLVNVWVVGKVCGRWGRLVGAGPGALWVEGMAASATKREKGEPKAPRLVT